MSISDPACDILTSEGWQVEEHAVVSSDDAWWSGRLAAFEMVSCEGAWLVDLLVTVSKGLDWGL